MSEHDDRNETLKAMGIKTYPPFKAEQVMNRRTNEELADALKKIEGELRRHREHLSQWSVRKHWTKKHLLQSLGASVHDVTMIIKKLVAAARLRANDGERIEGWTREVRYHKAIMCSQCDYMAREYRDGLVICTKCGWIDRTLILHTPEEQSDVPVWTAEDVEAIAKRTKELEEEFPLPKESG